MKKIYNNLNIENLIQVKWGNKFDEKQKVQIKLGLEENLDVSIYAKSEFDSEKMREIRFSLYF